MAHGDNGFDAMVAALGDGPADRDRFGADRDPADIGIDIHAGDDAAIAGAHRRPYFLPIVAISLADRLGSGGDQFLVFFSLPRGRGLSFKGGPGPPFPPPSRPARRDFPPLPFFPPRPS